jgi:hypothetical protein
VIKPLGFVDMYLSFCLLLVLGFWYFMEGVLTGRYSDLGMCPSCGHKKEPSHVIREKTFYCLECGRICKGWDSSSTVR